MKNSFVLLTVSLFILLLFPGWIRQGVFSDGVLYSAVSKNLSENRGTFWHPTFSPYLFAHFHEQPPMMFWMQSLFFQTIGDHFWTEKVYCFCMSIVVVIMLVLLFKFFSKNIFPKSPILLPVIYFLSVPVIPFVFINNLEEATLMVFDLIAIYGLVRYAFSPGKIKWGWFLIGVIAIIFAGLTKGIQGLFPIAIPFFIWACFRRTSFITMVYQSFLIVIVVAGFFILTSLNDVIRESYNEYFQSRLITAFGSIKYNTTTSHLYLIGVLAGELAIPLSIILLLKFFILKKARINSFSDFMRKESIFFFLIGLSASIPLIITLEQRRFYLATSIPFFALGFAMVSIKDFNTLLLIKHKSWIRKTINIFSVLIFASVVAYSVLQTGKFNRDEKELQDLKTIASYTGENVSLRTEKEIFENWGLHQYMVRYYNITLDFWNDQNYWFVKKNFVVPNNYKKVNLKTELYDLYQKN